jgi:hypothetical protein
MIEAALLPIALPRGVHEGETQRLTSSSRHPSIAVEDGRRGGRRVAEAAATLSPPYRNVSVPSHLIAALGRSHRQYRTAFRSVASGVRREHIPPCAWTWPHGSPCSRSSCVGDRPDQRSRTGAPSGGAGQICAPELARTWPPKSSGLRPAAREQRPGSSMRLSLQRPATPSSPAAANSRRQSVAREPSQHGLVARTLLGIDDLFEPRQRRKGATTACWRAPHDCRATRTVLSLSSG